MKKAFLILMSLLTLSAISPVIAAPNTWKIEYTLPGNCWDMDTGIGGPLSLTISGKVTGPPDYQEEQTVTDEPIYEEGTMSVEYDWWEESTHYKYEYYEWHLLEGTQSYSFYVERWYSPQPAFNGKLVVIWYDGSTQSFTVNFSPTLIERSARQGTVEGLQSYIVSEIIYREEAGNWVEDQVIQNVEVYDEPFFFGFDDLMLYLAFSGKIQTKGRPSLKGTFELWDTTSMYGQYIDGWGRFGPYELSIYG